MAIKRQHDDFTDSLHLLLRAHTENSDKTLCQIIQLALTWADAKLDTCSDIELVNGLENLLDDYKQLDNYEK